MLVSLWVTDLVHSFPFSLKPALLFIFFSTISPSFFLYFSIFCLCCSFSCLLFLHLLFRWFLYPVILPLDSLPFYEAGGGNETQLCHAFPPFTRWTFSSLSLALLVLASIVQAINFLLLALCFPCFCPSHQWLLFSFFKDCRVLPWNLRFLCLCRFLFKVLALQWPFRLQHSF